MNDKKEAAYKKAPWALIPKDNVKCPLKYADCNETMRTNKFKCNYNGCPYDISGNDGMFE